MCEDRCLHNHVTRRPSYKECIHVFFVGINIAKYHTCRPPKHKFTSSPLRSINIVESHTLRYMNNNLDPVEYFGIDMIMGKTLEIHPNEAEMPCDLSTSSAPP